MQCCSVLDSSSLCSTNSASSFWFSAVLFLNCTTGHPKKKHATNPQETYVNSNNLCLMGLTSIRHAPRIALCSLGSKTLVHLSAPCALNNYAVKDIYFWLAGDTFLDMPSELLTLHFRIHIIYLICADLV